MLIDWPIASSCVLPATIYRLPVLECLECCLLATNMFYPLCLTGSRLGPYEIVWALFEEQQSSDHTAILRSGQFRESTFASTKFQAFSGGIVSKLTQLDYTQQALRFERDGILFGATGSVSNLIRSKSLAIGSIAEDYESFEVAGIRFSKVWLDACWNPEHNCCIALLPSPSTTQPVDASMSLVSLRS